MKCTYGPVCRRYFDLILEIAFHVSPARQYLHGVETSLDGAKIKAIFDRWARAPKRRHTPGLIVTRCAPAGAHRGRNMRESSPLRRAVNPLHLCQLLPFLGFSQKFQFGRGCGSPNLKSALAEIASGAVKLAVCWKRDHTVFCGTSGQPHPERPPHLTLRSTRS